MNDKKTSAAGTARVPEERKESMVKIRISYEDTRELEKIIRLLHPVVKSYKISKGISGRFKKAYIEVKETKSDKKEQEHGI